MHIYLIISFFLMEIPHLSHSAFAPAHPEDCCFDFFSGKIPPEKILKVKETGSNCREKGFMCVSDHFII